MAGSVTQELVVGGGCFWCLEAVFEMLQGVHKVTSGFMGGNGPTTYKAVCTGRTGHAEVLKIDFDPTQIDVKSLLEVFFTSHDPTTLNRQGNDVGTQYRSAIFYASEAQKAVAEAVVAQVNESKLWPDPIVTEIAAATEFYPAEDYHQGYYRNNSFQPYCQFVVVPKVVKARKMFVDLLKKPAE